MSRNECAQHAAARVLAHERGGNWRTHLARLRDSHPPDTPLRLLGTTPAQLARVITMGSPGARQSAGREGGNRGKRFSSGRGSCARMKVAVTGGTGYVGPAVVEELLRAGHDVVVLEHHHAAPVGEHPRLSRAQGSVNDARSLREAFAGCDAVVHLVAILREDAKRHVTFERVHLEGTRNVVDAAKGAGVERFLLMSANGVESGLHTPYFDTKREMERMVKEAGFAWTIFRPSYIAGDAEGGFDAIFADIVDKAPVLPSFAGGKFEIQPIAREDVAKAFVRALATPESVGKAYTLVGPERMTWNDYLHRLADVRNRKRIVAYVPGPIVVGAARVAGRHFPADPDQLRMLMLGNTGDGSEAVRDFGLDLVAWDDAVSGLRR